MDDVEQKLTAARTRLILDKPFLGALVLRLPLVKAGNWCKTIGTDAKSLYYNHGYVEQLSLSEAQFVLAHEALHCGLSHFARRMHRDRKRWDIACDFAVNQLLVDENFELPPDALLDEEYKGMTAEEIYPCIDNDTNEEPIDHHLYDDSQSDDQSQADSLEQNSSKPDHDRSDQGNPAESNQSDTSSSRPPPLGVKEREQLDTQWQQRLAGAAQQAAQAGKLGSSVARMLERLLQPTVPWRSMLARYMSSSARLDYNLTRPSQRREGEAILPSLHTRMIDIVVALDTSGSIDQNELEEFVTELNAIKGAMNTRISLLACDRQLDQDCPWVCEPWETLHTPKQLAGGGGTDFRPVFDWLSGKIHQPDLLVYFTDAKGTFPPAPPTVPMMWLIKGNGKVPWGQRVQLN